MPELRKSGPSLTPHIFPEGHSSAPRSSRHPPNEWLSQRKKTIVMFIVFFLFQFSNVALESWNHYEENSYVLDTAEIPVRSAPPDKKLLLPIRIPDADKLLPLTSLQP